MVNPATEKCFSPSSDVKDELTTAATLENAAYVLNGYRPVYSDPDEPHANTVPEAGIDISFFTRNDNRTSKSIECLESLLDSVSPKLRSQWNYAKKILELATKTKAEGGINLDDNHGFLTLQEIDLLISEKIEDFDETSCEDICEDSKISQAQHNQRNFHIGLVFGAVACLEGVLESSQKARSKPDLYRAGWAVVAGVFAGLGIYSFLRGHARLSRLPATLVALSGATTVTAFNSDVRDLVQGLLLGYFGHPSEDAVQALDDIEEGN